MTLTIRRSSSDCSLCVEGMTPAGIHPALGPFFISCPAEEPCVGCVGLGVFPADFISLRAFDAFCLQNGYTAGFCVVCAGIVTLIVHGEDYTP